MAFDHSLLEQATAWAVKTGDPAFDDWADFTDWLEQSPVHAEAYDHVMSAAENSAAALQAAPANDVMKTEVQTGRRWIFAAIAACLALVAAVWVWQIDNASSVYRTDPGEIRRIALADGSAIVMAGDTKLVVDPDEARYARLERGRALFEIRHDESSPFRLDVGTATLVDAGTVFDVNIGSEAVGVSVSEGAVIYNPSKQNARVERGQILIFDTASADYSVTGLPVDQVGEWREGRLTFRDASLTDVAADIARASGIDYRVSAGRDQHRISGSITVDMVRANPSSLGPLLGVEVERRGDAWLLAAPW